MERLKKALKRAREESEVPRPGSTDRTIQSQIPESGAPIKHTQTREFKPDTEALAKNRVIRDTMDASHAAAVAAYNILRTQVLQRLRAKNWHTVGITSPTPGEGKTLTAINLAISVARTLTHTVVLVDLDLRRPSIHRYFNYKPDYGIADHLLADIPISEILFGPQVDNLVVLPGRESVANSSELLASPRMIRLIEEIKTRYPSCILLFDLPPLLAADDVLAFSPYADAVVLVIEDGKTPRAELSRCMEILDGTNLLGTVLNKSQEASIPYYWAPRSGDPA